MNDEQFFKLHRKYSHGIMADKMLDIAWTHSQIVNKIALQICERLEKLEIPVDKDLVRIGALVHDIGYYACFDNNYQKIEKYIRHGKLGYEYLKKEGFKEKIARFALIHTGVGVLKEQVIKENLPLEAKDYIPITLEEEIVTYADCFHSKGHPAFNTYEETKEELLSLNPTYGELLEQMRRKFGIPDLEILQKEYKQWHIEINQWVDQKNGKC